MTKTKYDPRVIISACAKEFGVRPKSITHQIVDNTTGDLTPRHTAMALCKDLCRVQLRLLTPHFNCHLSTLSKARQRVSDKVRHDKDFANQVSRIVRAVKK